MYRMFFCDPTKTKSAFPRNQMIHLGFHCSPEGYFPRSSIKDNVLIKEIGIFSKLIYVKEVDHKTHKFSINHPHFQI